MPPDDDFLSVTGSVCSDDSRRAEKAELEELRARVASLELREDARQRGSFWGS